MNFLFSTSLVHSHLKTLSGYGEIRFRKVNQHQCSGLVKYWTLGEHPEHTPTVRS